jgi:hypothetical protein
MERNSQFAQRRSLRLPLIAQNQTELRLNRSLVLGVSTNDPARLQGHHGRHLFLLIDEATAIPPEFFPAFEGILSSAHVKVLMLANPVTTAGYFRDAFGRNFAAWRTFNISAFNSPNFEGVNLEALLKMDDTALDTNVAPYLISRRWVRERFDEWWCGDLSNSPLWASRVLGAFPTSSTNSLIPIDVLEQARRPAMDPGTEVTIGIDPSGGGDLTAAVACCGGAIIGSMTSAARDSRPEVLAWLRKYFQRTKLVRFDSCGLGLYYPEPLRAAGYRCEGVNVASKPFDTTRFGT